MGRIFRRLLPLLALALVAAACSKGSTTVDNSSGATGATSAGGIVTSPPATGATGSTGSALGVAGTWTGEWQDDKVAAGHDSFTMTFTQNGDQISGPISINGSVCVTKGTISGTVTGNSIEFGAVQAEVKISYQGTISGDTMSGTYASSDPSCGPAATGTWTAQRTG
jgi:hypothetical protein